MVMVMVVMVHLIPTGIKERARHRMVLCLLADAFTALIPETELFMLSSCFRFVVCVKIFCARVTFSCTCREFQPRVSGNSCFSLYSPDRRDRAFHTLFSLPRCCLRESLLCKVQYAGLHRKHISKFRKNHPK